MRPWEKLAALPRKFISDSSGEQFIDSREVKRAQVLHSGNSTASVFPGDSPRHAYNRFVKDVHCSIVVIVKHCVQDK